MEQHHVDKTLLDFSFKKLRETNQNIVVESKYVDFIHLLFKGLIYKKLIKSYLRSSMTQERLNSLAIMLIESQEAR